MRNGFLECVAKRIVLGAFVAAAVVCGGSKGPSREGAAFVRAALTEEGAARSVSEPYQSSDQCNSGRARSPNAPQTVAQEDVARGYRFVGEATEAVSYAMPEAGVEVGNWHRRGTFGEWLRYELGWGFPLGSNEAAYSAFSVFSDAKIRPTPRGRSHEICAVGVQMLAMQGASRFWVASAARTNAAPSLVLTWENFYLNADTNAPVNAQIVLCESGDFVTRSNEVARYYARIDPNDWDGDGLANEIDDEPYTNGGDGFGTSVAWYNANCGGVLTASTNTAGEIEIGWRTNANPAAYYWLEFAATKDRTRVAVTCDGASTLGDMVVIARTNEVCRVPLLIGAAYAVRASAPLTGIVTSDGNANIVFNDNIQVGAARSVSEPYQGDWGQSHSSSDFASQSSSLRSSGDTVPLRSLYQSDPTSATQKNAAAPSRVAVAWGRASADFGIDYPLEFFFVPPPEGSGRTDYALTSTPVNVGAEILSLSGVCCTNVTAGGYFNWDCRTGCGCGGAARAVYAAVLWEGYSRSFSWWGECPCEGTSEETNEASELKGRRIGLRVLDSVGDEIAWETPVLTGEFVIVEVEVGGDALSVADFVDFLDGELLLKVWTVDYDGRHDLAEATVPLGTGSVISRGENVFRVTIPATWLATNGLVRNTEDGRASKTSIDMSDAEAGSSNRGDSDLFDRAFAGLLVGRARGSGQGNKDATIPEGCLNLRTFQAAGTGVACAVCGSAVSGLVQFQQQADVVFYSGHGHHSDGSLQGGVRPADLKDHWNNVDTLILSGCAVLDIGNFRRQSFGWKTTLQWKLKGGANSPGEQWEELDVDLLLGFAWKAPLDNAGGQDVIRDFVTAVGLGADYVSAWRDATDSGAARNACVIDKTATPHIYWYWDEQSGTPIWTNAVKKVKGWVE